MKQFTCHGRQGPLPEIDHVESETENNKESEIPQHLRKYTLYALEPQALANKFLNKPNTSHMRKYFVRGSSEEVEKAKASKNVTKRSYKRKRKVTSGYVTKEAKLQKLKDLAVPCINAIDAILESQNDFKLSRKHDKSCNCSHNCKIQLNLPSM